MTTLLHTKKIIYDNYGEIPPMLAFIGIDTDEGDYNKELVAHDGKKISLDTNERLSISVGNPSAIYHVGKGKGKFGWIAPGNVNSLTVLNRGAGQIRSNGRFAITYEENSVKAKLAFMRNQITNIQLIGNPNYKLLDTNIDVHIIFSMAGGTGGGTFINLAYLVQQSFPGCRISGYAVMGGVFDAMLNGAAVARVLSNSYGSIMDLDYLMSLSPSSTPITIELFNTNLNTTERPFNAIYLIDNVDKNGNTYEKVDQISEMISLALVTSIGKLGDATKSVADNIEQHITAGNMDMEGKRAWVSSLGVGEIIYSGESLAQIYANEAREQLTEMITSGGKGGDTTTTANNWIDENAIRENHNKDDVIDYFDNIVGNPNFPFYDIEDTNHPEPECELYINEAQEKEVDLNNKLQELKDRISTSLDKLVQGKIKEQGGVSRCGDILTALNSEFSLCNTEMKDETEKYSRKKEALDDALKVSQESLKECILFKKNKKVSVLEDTMAVAICQREITRRKMAQKFYDWIISEVNEYIKRIETLRVNLKTVSDNSIKNVQAIRRKIENNPIIFQHDLAKYEVDSINCQSKDIVFNDFVVMMDKKGGLWTFATGTSQYVANCLWEFTSTMSKAQEYCKKTVNDVLNTLDSGKLKSACDTIIAKAQTLLRTDTRGYQATSNPDNSYYVGVEDKALSVLGKNNLFKTNVPDPQANVNIVSIGLKDRVIIFHQFGVLPAFAVKPLDGFLNDYETNETAQSGTSHWDYGLYQRFINGNFDIMPKNNAAQGVILQLWVQALLFGIITKDDKDFFIESKALGGRPIEQFKVLMANDRIGAYKYFAKKIPVIKNEIVNKINSLGKKDRTLPGKLKTAAQQETAAGVYHLPGHLSLNDIDFTVKENREIYKDEYDLLDKEIEYIESL